MPESLTGLSNSNSLHDAEALLRFAADQMEAEFVTFPMPSGPDFEGVILPEGRLFQPLTNDLDTFRPRPRRAKGFASLESQSALIAHILRHKDVSRSVVFGRVSTGRIVAVYDYHQVGAVGAETQTFPDPAPENQILTPVVAGTPGWCEHGATYVPEHSVEWKKWQEQNGKSMLGTEFAAFLEDRIADVLADIVPGSAVERLKDLLGGDIATPSILMSFARHMQVNEKSRAKSVSNLSTGEVQIEWSTEHAVSAPAGTKVPSLFAIGIPVYQYGVRYQLAARLRYRVRDGVVHWFYDLHGMQEARDLAFAEILQAVRDQTGLLVLEGAIS